jgi:hypothetical protein
VAHVLEISQDFAAAAIAPPKPIKNETQRKDEG